jgi:hypothetical protein
LDVTGPRWRFSSLRRRFLASRLSCAAREGRVGRRRFGTLIALRINV